MESLIDYAIKAAFLPVRAIFWSVRMIYNVMMLPFDIFFQIVNSYIPVEETLESSKDMVRDMTSSSMFVMTSIFTK